MPQAINAANQSRKPVEFYFEQFEDRLPPKAYVFHLGVSLIWQFCASASAVLGAWYLIWRWSQSLNPDALWLSIPLAVAETCAYIGMLLFFHNLWSDPDLTAQPLPDRRKALGLEDDTGPIGVDVFITTYDEDPELVRLTIRDALAIRVPKGVMMQVYVLDDGCRLEMGRIAREEGAAYLARAGNIGYKAGNMRHALGHSSGDIILICDADTRPLPEILEETLGYFRDPTVAWVQTPQWFYDIHHGQSLSTALRKMLGRPGHWLGSRVEALFGPIALGKDPMGLDPAMFYDVIQRRRNKTGASFCCGAGSLQRRDAVIEGALRRHAQDITNKANQHLRKIRDAELRADMAPFLERALQTTQEFMPFRFHVSEDIYTSILLHEDGGGKWRSILHPRALTRALSPQDLDAMLVQRFKYAGGTIDIALRDNPLFRKGMPLRTRLYYAMTFWSHFAPLWELIFLLVPLITLYTGIAPVSAYSTEFFWHFLPFILMHELALMLGTWGVDKTRGTHINAGLIGLKLRALWTVLRGREIRFKTTPKLPGQSQSLRPVRWHILFAILSIGAAAMGIWRFHDSADPVLRAAIGMNLFWVALNLVTITPLIRAAFFRAPIPKGSPS